MLARAPRRTPMARLHAAGGRLAATAWRRWFLDRHAEFWLGELDPSWSLVERRARVVEVIDETADTRTFVLDPGRRWPGHRAGQHVPITVEIDGVRTRRCYSISSGASTRGARRIAITVQRTGRVSSWLHAHAGPGTVLGFGRPAGEFVLPGAAPRLLLVAGGSGITPIMAMLRELERRAALHDVVLIHCARSARDTIFGRELAILASQEPGLRLVAHHTGERGRLDPPALRALVPDLADRELYVCGPPGLFDVVSEAAAGAGVTHRVHHERFVAPSPAPASAAPVVVTLARAGRDVTVAGPGPLLAQLERAGERPAHGCRIGICNTCRCRKLRGTVEDLVTGAISSEPDQDIRPCVSIARSDLELAL